MAVLCEGIEFAAEGIGPRDALADQLRTTLTLTITAMETADLAHETLTDGEHQIGSFRR